MPHKFTEMDKLIGMLKDCHVEYDLADFSGTRILSYPFHGDGCKVTLEETDENWGNKFGLMDMDDNRTNTHIRLQDAESAWHRIMEIEKTPKPVEK